MSEHDAAAGARALALDRELRTRASERIVASAWGRALLCPSLPRVFNLNVLHVDAAGDGLDAQGLQDEADLLLGGAGLRHRRVLVDDEALGERLTDGLLALGWQVRPFGLMVHRRPLDRPPDPALAREVDVQTLQEIHRAYLRTQPYGSDEETVRQLLEADARVSRACGGRHFGGFDDGRPACHLSLYSDGAAAQLEAMATLPAARGKGIARSVMALGVQTAAAGHELTTLATVEEVDWLRALYERMGFELVGRWFSFNRLPA